MMKVEFEQLVGKEVSMEEWNIIEVVYMYYPRFTKEITVKLYQTFGIIIFHDLYSRASEIMELDIQINELIKWKIKLEQVK